MRRLQYHMLKTVKQLDWQRRTCRRLRLSLWLDYFSDLDMNLSKLRLFVLELELCLVVAVFGTVGSRLLFLVLVCS